MAILTNVPTEDIIAMNQKNWYQIQSETGAKPIKPMMTAVRLMKMPSAMYRVSSMMKPDRLMSFISGVSFMLMVTAMVVDKKPMAIEPYVIPADSSESLKSTGVR